MWDSVFDNYGLIRSLSDFYHAIGSDGIGAAAFLDVVGMLIITDKVKENKIFVRIWNTIAVLILVTLASLWIMGFTGWINVEPLLGPQYIFAGKASEVVDADNNIRRVPDGYGRQFDLDGNLIYKGYFQRGVYHGQGTYFWPRDDSDGRDYYTGNYEHGERQDTNGVLCWTDGRRYEGTFTGGMRTGQGTFYFAEGDPVNRACYTGGFHNGNFDGFGKLYWNSGDYLEYSLVDGVEQGNAVYHWEDGDWEERTYMDGVMQGSAIYHSADGRTEQWQYKDGERVW